MNRSSLETRIRRSALAALAVTVSVATGAGVARWAIADTNGFYMAPIDRYGTPAYARRQPVADTFWERQADAGATSTATSAQPAYLSASGS